MSGSTRVWRDADGNTICRAGVLAATARIAGMGTRLPFDVWAHTHVGQADMIRFSVDHSITTANAYVTAFVLMAFVQVGLRVGLLRVRRVRVERLPVPSLS